MQLLLLARHGQSLFNVAGIVNGDPERDRGLSPVGVEEADRLAAQIAAIRIELSVTSRFPRAGQTAERALANRTEAVSRIVDGDLDDIRLGELEGKTLADYRAWKRGRGRDEPFPGIGGESLNDAAHRYASAYERILAADEATVLCVCHEIPVRYAINAAAGSWNLDSPHHDVANATVYAFDGDGLRRAIARIRTLADA